MTDVAQRMRAIAPFRVMEILARARAMEAAGRDVVHMEIGEPDFVSPQPVIDAGIASLRAGLTHYTPAAGLPKLREAIAAYYRQRFAVTVDPAHIIITPGSSGALQLVLGALVNPGDEVLLTAAYTPVLRLGQTLQVHDPWGGPSYQGKITRLRHIGATDTRGNVRISTEITLKKPRTHA